MKESRKWSEEEMRMAENKFKKHVEVGKEMLPLILKAIERNKDILFSGVKAKHDYDNVPEYPYGNKITELVKNGIKITFRINIVIDMEGS